MPITTSSSGSLAMTTVVPCAGPFGTAMCYTGSSISLRGANGLQLPHPVESSYTCELHSELSSTAARPAKSLRLENQHYMTSLCLQVSYKDGSTSLQVTFHHYSCDVGISQVLLQACICFLVCAPLQ